MSSTASCTHNGERLEVHSLPSPRDAALVQAAFTSKQHVEERALQRTLQRALALDWSASTTGTRAPAEAAAAWADKQLAALSWHELARQLQACVDSVNRTGSSPEAGPPGYSLLAATAILDLPGALLALACTLPTAVAWEDMSGRRLSVLAAQHGSAAALEALLSGGYASSRDTTRGGDSLLHVAAGGQTPGHLAVIDFLLRLSPGLATARGDGGYLPLHLAAEGGSPEAVSLLLAAAPAAATCAAEQDGRIPLHVAALRGNAEAVELLLAAAPETALWPDHDSGANSMHLAAQRGHVAAVEALLRVCPKAAASPDMNGWLPLMAASDTGQAAAVALLLAAAPEAALETDPHEFSALHLAAAGGHAEATRLLLEAVPQALDFKSRYNDTALSLALLHNGGRERLATARCLLDATPLEAGLKEMVRAGPSARPLWPYFVVRHRPLTPQQWQQVPAPCPGLGWALPPLYWRSPEQARLLVEHLPPEEKAALQTAALCLARLQRQLDIPLPGFIVGRIMSLCLAV